ncbi:MAG TPA: hypothetical protein VML96_11845 [Egibacteraceae bacterium]|nr:hypothetical protein [Egibacteraceae bacterium]
MSHDEHEHITHQALAAQLRDSIQRLRRDVESRSDPILDEVAHALDLILEITTHAHDHAIANSRRLDVLEPGD